MNIIEAKKVLTDSVSIECEGGNFSYGKMSPYAFKHEKWGPSCNVIFFEEGDTRRFLLLSNFSTTLSDEKWALSEASHILKADDNNYIITNLTEEEIEFIKNKMIIHYGHKRNWF